MILLKEQVKLLKSILLINNKKISKTNNTKASINKFKNDKIKDFIIFKFHCFKDSFLLCYFLEFNNSKKLFFVKKVF